MSCPDCDRLQAALDRVKARLYRPDGANEYTTSPRERSLRDDILAALTSPEVTDGRI